MTDETQNQNAGEQSLSAEQLLRLKQEIEKKITYGPGLNAREVEALKTLNADMWAKIRRDYDDWNKRTTVYSNRALLVVAAAGAFGCFWFIGHNGWVRLAAIVAGVVAFFVLIELGRREGHREGYVDGYESGFEEGIHKAYGIDEKEAMDIHERAIDMQIDEGVIKAFDEKRKTP